MEDQNDPAEQRKARRVNHLSVFYPDTRNTEESKKIFVFVRKNTTVRQAIHPLFADFNRDQRGCDCFILGCFNVKFKIDRLNIFAA